MKPIATQILTSFSTLAASSLFTIPLILSGAAEAGEQQLTPFPLSQQAASGSPVAITVTYTSRDPEDMSLPGLGLRLHWSSTQLDFQDISEVLPTGLVGQSPPEVDSDDLDGDPATDRYVLLAWADYTGSWPGTGAASVPLFTVRFQPTTGFSGTVLRFSSPSTAAGYTLAAAQAKILFGDDGDLELIFEDGYEGADGAGWRLLLESPQS